MRSKSEIRTILVNEMVDAGELIRRGEDFFEDMGGHILHESNLDSYIESYMKALPEIELRALVDRAMGM